MSKARKYMYTAILFDMDGVLIDSEEVMLQSTIEALAQFGVQAKPGDFAPYVGKGEDLYIGRVAEQYGHAYIPEMKAKTYETYGRNISEKNAIPGAAALIRTICSIGVPHALCSGGELPKVRHNLRALGLSELDFDAVLTANDVTRNKPFPDMYLMGAARLGKSIGACVVVDDTLSGVQAGKSAGAYTIAIGGSYTEEQFRKQGLADLYVERTDMLEDIFRTMGIL